MKKFVFVLLALAAMFAAPALAQDAAVAAPEALKPWQDVMWEVILLVIQILAPIAGLLVTWVVWKLAQKFGIEESAALDALIKEKVGVAVEAAESWAKGNADKVSSSDKLNKAIEMTKALLEGTGAKKLAEEKLKLLIEGVLAEKKDLVAASEKE